MDKSNNSRNKDHEERRRYKRIKKNFILKYYLLDEPHHKYEISQLKDISIGGMCFITSKAYPPSSKLGVELKTPYLADTTFMVGTVLESHEKAKNILFQTRLKFEDLSPQAEFLLAKLVEFFVQEG